MRHVPLIVGLAAVLAAVAPGRAGQGAPTPTRTGEAIFKDKCIYCHDARGWGTRALARRLGPQEAMLTARTNLPADYVKMVVRRGIGSMPAFTPTDMSDADISTVSAWLARKQ